MLADTIQHSWNKNNTFLIPAMLKMGKQELISALSLSTAFTPNNKTNILEGLSFLFAYIIFEKCFWQKGIEEKLFNYHLNSQLSLDGIFFRFDIGTAI